MPFNQSNSDQSDQLEPKVHCIGERRIGEPTAFALRVALRISASSPQGPKARSPFAAPSCCGFLRLLCVSFARALRLSCLAPLACTNAPRTNAPLVTALCPPLSQTPPLSSLHPSAALHVLSGAALVRFLLCRVRLPPPLCASHAPLSERAPCRPRTRVTFR